jgi:hypothetical protein
MLYQTCASDTQVTKKGQPDASSMLFLPAYICQADVAQGAPDPGNDQTTADIYHCAYACLLVGVDEA